MREGKKSEVVKWKANYTSQNSPPIHCDPSLNACLDSRACNVDVNLT